MTLSISTRQQTWLLASVLSLHCQQPVVGQPSPPSILPLRISARAPWGLSCTCVAVLVTGASDLTAHERECSQDIKERSLGILCSFQRQTHMANQLLRKRQIRKVIITTPPPPPFFLSSLLSATLLCPCLTQVVLAVGRKWRRCMFKFEICSYLQCRSKRRLTYLQKTAHATHSPRPTSGLDIYHHSALFHHAVLAFSMSEDCV